MGGFVIDIFLVYVLRVLVRAWKRTRTSSWELLTARVAEASCPMMPLGCPVAEIVYVYVVLGETYSGLASVPFIWQSSADLYVQQHPPGALISVRVSQLAPLESFMPKVPPLESAKNAGGNAGGNAARWTEHKK